MKWNIFILALMPCPFSSCNPLALKPLDIKTIEKDGITARWFRTSGITAVHSHVEIKTRNGWVQVMEANEIQAVFINKDTVIIRVAKGMPVYELKSVYRGTYVRLDSINTGS